MRSSMLIPLCLLIVLESVARGYVLRKRGESEEISLLDKRELDEAFLDFLSKRLLDESERTEALHAHNVLRAVHQDTPPVTWSDDVAAHAQKWVNVMAERGQFQHSKSGTEYRDKDSGENIYWTSDPKAEHVMTQAIVSFYSEEYESQYNYQSGKGNGGVIGHFTQLVWDDTTSIGCAKAVKESGNMAGTFVVCQYSPPGNWGGVYPKHVHPPKQGMDPKTVATNLLNDSRQ